MTYQKQKRNTPPIYEVGDRIGKLTVIEPCVNGGPKNIHYTTQCDCGKVTKPLKRNLENGMSKSCGCTRGGRGQGKRLTDGLGSSRLTKIWRMMHHRCEHHTRYIDKGLTVSPEWSDLEAFIEWSLANGYDDKLSIDRIDNARGYSPDNCRWADDFTQSQNRDSAYTDDMIFTAAIKYFYTNASMTAIARDVEFFSPGHMKTLIMRTGWYFPAFDRQATDPAIANAIRHEHQTTGDSFAKIGKRHGISGHTVSRIVKGSK